MGNNASQLEEMVASSNFSADEVQRLYKRFVKLDKDGSGTIDKEEFLALPQIGNNPLAARLLSVLDGDGTGDIDFKEFIAGLSAFLQRATRRTSSDVYDMDRDGFISNGELFLVLKMMVGTIFGTTNFNRLWIKLSWRRTWTKTGRSPLRNLLKVVENTDIARQMTLESDRFKWCLIL
ncbi:calcineurin regulatory subunit B [Chytridium lagenaria]|nr:calcineurin regulatory subunit B [Chytridium lagenaria]